MLRIRSQPGLAVSYLTAVLCILPSVAYPQSLLQGTVLDDATDGGIAGARVDLIDHRDVRVASLVTSESGRFTLTGLAAGRYRIRATRIGYEAAVTPPMDIGEADTVAVVVRLSVEAVLLAPLEVVAHSARPQIHTGLSEFHRRKERSVGGVFIESEEIERRGPPTLIDVVRNVPGVRVLVGRTGLGAVLMGRTLCPPAVYIDGTLVYQPSGGGLYDLTQGDGTEATAAEALAMVPPSAVEGVEVYTGASQVPAEFSGSTAGCGVIAVWTRRGRE